MNKQLSVVICTRNRAASLERTLRSLAESARPYPRDVYEILVVDNGGNLSAQALETEFGELLPLRLIREEQPGLSIARNTGVKHALGKWIVWTDDDVSVDSGWLARYFQAMEEFPDANVMGGPIVPKFEGHAPQWLIDGQHHIQTAFAARSADDVSAVFQAGDAIPWGANFATLKSAVVRYPFDAELGRHPNRPVGGGEESAVIRQILAAGGTGRWLKNASVVRHIDTARQATHYVRAYYVDLSFRNTLSANPEPGRGWALRHCCGALYRAAGNEFRYQLARLRPSGSDLALHLKNAARNWGAARAWFKLVLGTAPRWETEL